jgi:hypothetical protein
MAAASAASTRAASSQPEATQSTVSRMAGAGGVNTRAASSPLEAILGTACCTEGAGGASTRAAPRQLLQAARSTASRTEGASAASTRAASSPLEAILGTACCTEGAGGASTRAAPRQLLQAARPIAPRMAGAGAASRRAAPRQSLELPAVCTARCVSSASSPTMRRTMHRNSVARPRLSATGGIEELVRELSPAAAGGECGATQRLRDRSDCVFCASLVTRKLNPQLDGACSTATSRPSAQHNDPPPPPRCPPPPICRR